MTWLPRGTHVGSISKVFSTTFKVDLVVRLGTGRAGREGCARERGCAQAPLPLAEGLSGAWGRRAQPQARAQGRVAAAAFRAPRVVRAGVRGRRPVRRRARRRTRKGQGADRRTRAVHRPPAGGPAFFSRSLAALGREAPKRRRAHLYAVIEEMTVVEPQGFSENGRQHPASVRAQRRVARQLLPPSRAQGRQARRRGSARSDPAPRAANRHYGYRRIAHELRRQGLDRQRRSACCG